MENYSKIYESNGRHFRYNYKKALLQWVCEDEVIDAVGLSRDNWEENPEYWIDNYNKELDDEIATLM